MILVKKEDIYHKLQLQKLLIKLTDDQFVSQMIYFKGGTCAEMSGFLDRFSVDLDFDLKESVDPKPFRSKIEKIAKKLDLINKTQNAGSLFFTYKYKSLSNQRNTLKLSFFENNALSNDYEPRFLPEIDRTVNCQTLETMFANKLAAPLDRYNKHKEIAGRDIYDIHYFFSRNYDYKPEIIEERTGLKEGEYIKKLIKFIEEKITDKIITEDLNALLPFDRFNEVRKTLKPETLLFLRNLIF